MAHTAEVPEFTLEVITEADLLEIRVLREQLTQMRALAKAATARLSELEHGVMSALERGAVVEGRLTAIVEQRAGTCRPHWRDEYLNHMEMIHNIAREAAEHEVRSEYPPEMKDILVIGDAPDRSK